MNADLLFHVLLALAVLVVAGRLVGVIVARVGQPPVIGEVLAGILLGPSLLGAIAPGFEAFLFPESARPALGVIAQIGVIMALVTTAMTTPLLGLVPPDRREQ